VFSLLRRHGLLVVIPAAAACGQPATAPSPPSATVTLSGVVVSTQDGDPVPGASIWLRGLDGINRFTGPGGWFTLQEPRTASGLLQIWMAQGRVPEFGDVVPRELTMSLLASRDEMRVDVIRIAPPFSMTLYEELVRDAHDGPGTRATRPWTVDPSFYLLTTHVETGAPIPESVLDGVERVFRNSVPELTGGRRRVAAVERGPEPRDDRDGWVNVFFQDILPHEGASGQATVGGNQGTMWLYFDPFHPEVPETTGLPCANVLGIADHEIAHTMGFWHASAIPGVLERPLNSLDYCEGAPRPDIVRYHAGIMYSRPPGNLPPDRDPSSLLYARAGSGGPGPVVHCVFGSGVDERQ